MEFTKFIEETYKLFELFEKPEVATDIDHCEECRDHNDEIAKVDRKDLSSEQIGTACWGVTSFLTAEAMGYYIPRLIELALLAEDDKDGTPYMCLFINQIGLNSNSEQFFMFTNEHKGSVYHCLKLIKSNFLDILLEHCWDDEIDNAINQWSPKK